MGDPSFVPASMMESGVADRTADPTAARSTRRRDVRCDDMMSSS